MGPYGWQPAKPLIPAEAEQLRAMWERKHAPPDNENPVMLVGGRVHWFGESPQSALIPVLT